MGRQVRRPDFAELVGGGRLLEGMEPAAHCYCGYQFGMFAGQLGDGAALYLGEVPFHFGIGDVLYLLRLSACTSLAGFKSHTIV